MRENGPRRARISHTMTGPRGALNAARRDERDLEPWNPPHLGRTRSEADRLPRPDEHFASRSRRERMPSLDEVRDEEDVLTQEVSMQEGRRPRWSDMGLRPRACTIDQRTIETVEPSVAVEYREDAQHMHGVIAACLVRLFGTGELGARADRVHRRRDATDDLPRPDLALATRT